MTISMRPNPFAMMSAHALASLPLSFLMMKTKTERLKMLCCSIFARAVEEYFQPFCFEPFAPMLMGFCATAAVQTWVLREDKPLPLMQAASLNLGARTVIWVTALAFWCTASTDNLAVMTMGSVGGAIFGTWAVYQIAKRILTPEKPKTA